jgi:hypothetical protein
VRVTFTATVLAKNALAASKTEVRLLPRRTRSSGAASLHLRTAKLLLQQPRPRSCAPTKLRTVWVSLMLFCRPSTRQSCCATPAPTHFKRVETQRRG